jgi:spore maturation protein A
MLNYVWMGMLVVGFITGILNGRLEVVTQAAFSSAGRAVELSIGLLGIICLWSGLMNIAEKSGLVRAIARVTRPLLKLLFPQIAKNNKALGAIVMNLAANFLGVGNAATPLGIRAMTELQKVNNKSDTASDSMSMILV